MTEMSAAASRPRVLVVEDERPIRELLRLHLNLAGFAIDETGDGRDALDRTRAEAFDLLILDVMLPGLDGVSLCRAIRADGPNRETPVLMLTVRDGESDKVLGLESGADDYLTKPFGVRELVARIGAIMRRSARGAVASTAPGADRRGGAGTRRVSSRQLVLDAERREATVRGQPVELTKQEFDLLYRLAARPGIVLSRAALLQNVWSDDTYVTERTVDTVISRLRRKIERDPQDPELILTAWGVGYKFADAE
jgi:DNA-binding response OmpR family regulator